MLARSSSIPISADDLTCPICLERFTSPLLLPCCANSFCRQCLKKALARRPACPLCNAEADYADALPNRTLTRLLASQPDGGGGGPVRITIPSEKPQNRFLRPDRRKQELSRCWEWWHENEARLRCLFYVALVATLMITLKVNEEEYARQHGVPMSRFAVRTAHMGALPGV